MDIRKLDAHREAQKIPKGALCRAAKVARSTYKRLLERPDSGRVDTLRKLARVLDAMIEARRAAA